MVKLMQLPLIALGAASTAQAYKQISCTPTTDGSNPCPVGYCVETFEGSNTFTCQKIIRKWTKVMPKTNDLKTIENTPQGKSGGAPEFRNTHTYCAIPREGVVYKEVPEHWQPVVEKCWHNPSGNELDVTKIRNDTVGVNKQHCKLRCPDHRMDPVFYGKNEKITDPVTGKNQYINTRVFQVSCDCMAGDKGPGFCGWKTTGSGIKEFAGGNLACDYTFFAVKPIWMPSNYNDRSDEAILENFAWNRKDNALYQFNQDNFDIKYYIIRREWDEDQQKHIKVELPLDDNGNTIERDGHLNSYTYVNDRTGLQMYPTDLIIQNDSGKNGNQHNKAEQSLNIRAKIACKSHTNGRYFATLMPWCKNKRHVLKKGRPGDCGWRIETLWPNKAENFVDKKDTDHPYFELGFDPTAPKQGKAGKYKKNEAKKSGIGNKKAEALIGQILKGNRHWRCEDFA